MANFKINKFPAGSVTFNSGRIDFINDDFAQEYFDWCENEEKAGRMTGIATATGKKKYVFSAVIEVRNPSSQINSRC